MSVFPETPTNMRPSRRNAIPPNIRLSVMPGCADSTARIRETRFSSNAMGPPCGLTFEFTRLRKQAKPAVARRVQRRVSPRSVRYGCEEQHGDDNCTGGQATLPNEQKT